MEGFIVLGVMLLLTWFLIYFKYFREKEGAPGYSGKKEAAPDGRNEEEKVYSVAPWGDDGNAGSLSSPWKTLQHAVNNLQAGDRLLIREGTYKEHVSFKKSGTGENPITVSVFQGEEAVLDGEGAGWKYGFNFEFGVSFVTLSGLKVRNFARYGFALWGENRSVRLRNLEATGCSTGLHIISAENMLVEGCSFYNNSGPGLAVSPGPIKTARIVNTRSSYNDGPEPADGFVLDSGEDIVIEKCNAEYNSGSGFNCLTAKTVISAGIARHNGRYGIKCRGEGYTLVNCIIDGNGMAGIALQGGGSYELFNNLAVNCGLKGDYGLVAAPEAGAAPARVTLVNNIFAYNYGGVHFGSSAMLEREDHNIFWSRADAEISSSTRRYSRAEINEQIWFKETGRGEKSFCRDPLFVDPSRGDFRLARNSPAIDRGAGEGAPGTDINGMVRPQGRGVDIGPYESPEGSLIPPAAAITHSPGYSSDASGSLKFSVKWAGILEGGEVAGFNVQFKDGAGGAWQNWLADTKENEGLFTGAGGHTYYFRVRAKDGFGNWGNWSEQRCTVVPVDDQSPLIRYEGNWDCINAEEAYLNTLHHSDRPGAAASLRFTGTEIAWISAEGPDRGQALVYIDDVLQATVDLYCGDCRFRRPVFKAPLDGRPHTIRVEVAATKNQLSKGYRVDVDGFAVRS
ncbi:MAG: hypothetical protein HPY89_04345 [Pelotomaculum sp.]|uniref:Right handed beta helix domain-containing protein n=1 Tax=Pelotomaculum thermopropionicum (strain DSM 13744 / JCM 10971 / SI) TaxID=370438 RepID=A5D382_PELTS|nr:hypothetical protein [Pelotomaculum sp.]BAF59283.1 hypothetical protein PTH_1102 [Pelotomaculum thermopropionicum SI]